MLFSSGQEIPDETPPDEMITEEDPENPQLGNLVVDRRMFENATAEDYAIDEQVSMFFLLVF